MGKPANLRINITSDARQAKAELDATGDAVERSTSRFERFNNGMARAAVPAAAAAAAIGAVGKQALDSASALQQATGANEAVFGQQSALMKRYADEAAQNLGLAKSDYLQMTTIIGSQLKNMGVPTKDLTGQTQKLMELGADLAAQFGGSTSDAVEALSSLMRGERDPIERYGVSINEAAIKAEKAKMGLSGLTGEADKQATTQATLALLTRQTAAAHGAFAREANTAAGAQERANAKMENAKAAIGEALLPVAAQLAQALATVAVAAGQHPAILTAIVVGIGSLVGIVLAYNAAVMAAPAMMAVATAAQWAWNTAMSANPIGLVILAIAALIAIVVLLVRHWDTVKRVGADTWAVVSFAAGKAAQWIRDRWKDAGDAFNRTFIDPIRRGLDWLQGAIDSVLGALGSIQFPSPPGWLSSIVGFSAPPVGGVLAPATGHVTASTTWTPSYATSLRSAGPSSRPTQVNQFTIEGALDPIAVGRQIRDILNTEARSSGRISRMESVL